MTNPTPSTFDFAALYDDAPEVAVALTECLLLDPDEVARRLRFQRAVRTLPGFRAGATDFGPEVALVVDVGLGSAEGRRALADPETLERVSRMLDDPDALAEAHRRMSQAASAPLAPWPTADEIVAAVRRADDDHRDDPEPMDDDRAAGLLDEIRDQLYADAPVPNSELVRFYETAGFEWHDLRTRQQSGNRRGTPLVASARQLAEWQQRAAVALRRLRAESPAFGRVYVLRKYGLRTAAEIAALLGLAVETVEQEFRKEEGELAAATP